MIDTAKLYKNTEDFEVKGWRWPHFSPAELKCKCRNYCDGEYYHDPKFLDGLEAMRKALGKPIIINSARRCKDHNKAVGGVSNSMHTVSIAVDIAIDDHDRKDLFNAALKAGFTGMGFGVTFMHLDRGKKRRWDYPGGISRWINALGFNPIKGDK